MPKRKPKKDLNKEYQLPADMPKMKKVFIVNKDGKVEKHEA